MRKIIASVAVIMCITTPTYAMNFCDSGWNYLEGQNAFIHKAGLDQENLDKKTFQKTGYLHAQIKQLQAENEQLRNSISLMRSGKIALGVSEHDPRILGLIDENKRLSAQLGQERVQSSFIDQYVQQITTLKYENQKLSRKVGELIITSAMGGNSSGGDTTQILLLRQQIKTLQEENRDASTALAKITQKALASDKFADKANNAYENNLKAVELLKQRLSKAQEENKGLQAKLDFAYKDAVSNDDFGVLRQQNESLRATIQAQNELLRSTDNAAKTAERLLTENTMLQHKLQLVEKFGNANNRNTKEMAERVKVLEKDVVQRDTYIKKMIAAKSAELAAMSKSNTPNIVGETASLREN
ncbi:MAG: hypothetical protein KAJ40_08945, partial [Alphaproteobacteria bacterium]|nr:hypothetical protein [Alphaproteobacteria bacterium]